MSRSDKSEQQLTVYELTLALQSTTRHPTTSVCPRSAARCKAALPSCPDSSQMQSVSTVYPIESLHVSHTRCAMPKGCEVPFNHSFQKSSQPLSKSSFRACAWNYVMASNGRCCRPQLMFFWMFHFEPLK